MSENVTREDLLKDCIIALARFDAGDTPEFKHGLLAKPTDPTPLYWKTAIAQDFVPHREMRSIMQPGRLQPIPRKVLSFRARARTTDPATSHTAAATVDITKDVYQRILGLLRYGPQTDEHLMNRWNSTREVLPYWPAISPSGLRSRRAELVAAGKVVDSGERGQTAAGRSCIVWRLA